MMNRSSLLADQLIRNPMEYHLGGFECNASGLVVADKHAYVVDYSWHLHVIDIGISTKPKEVPNYSYVGRDRDRQGHITVADNHA